LIFNIYSEIDQPAHLQGERRMFIQRGRYCSNVMVKKLRDLAEINVFLLVFKHINVLGTL